MPDTETQQARPRIDDGGRGSDALEWESERSRGGKTSRDWLRTKANSIEGGTSEIQLGIVAKRILDLPEPDRMPLYLNDDQVMLRDNRRGFMADKGAIRRSFGSIATCNCKDVSATACGGNSPSSA